MSQSQPPWRRHRIPDLALSFEVNPASALDVRPLDGGAIVSQRLSDAAAVFVRYGADQTLDRFLGALGDALTTATVVDDESTRIGGVPARRVTVRLDRRPVPGPASGTSTLLRVTGFAVRGVPVLVGYRVREDQSAEVRATLDRIVASVDVNRDDDPARPG